MILASSILIYSLANSADLASTRYLQARGGREAWLPTQSFSGQIAIKALATALEAAGDDQLRKHGHAGWARVGRVAIIVVSGYAVIHNLREAKGR